MTWIKVIHKHVRFAKMTNNSYAGPALQFKDADPCMIKGLNYQLFQR